MTTYRDAVTNLLSRIARDPRLAYYFDPLTRSMEELTSAFALDHGLDVESFRETYYRGLRFECPICAECISEGVKKPPEKVGRI
jgi:hypothetical protein